MSNTLFGTNTPDYTALTVEQREFLIEHYKRIKDFWIHWTPTIWSLPSVAAAINIGAYSFLFDKSKNVPQEIQTLALAILSLLNLALALGVWKHRYMQKVFGDRLVNIERYAGIQPVVFSDVQKAVSGSWFYVVATIAIFLISLFLLVQQFKC